MHTHIQLQIVLNCYLIRFIFVCHEICRFLIIFVWVLFSQKKREHISKCIQLKLYLLNTYLNGCAAIDEAIKFHKIQKIHKFLDIFFFSKCKRKNGWKPLWPTWDSWRYRNWHIYNIDRHIVQCTHSLTHT